MTYRLQQWGFAVPLILFVHPTTKPKVNVLGKYWLDGTVGYLHCPIINHFIFINNDWWSRRRLHHQSVETARNESVLGSVNNIFTRHMETIYELDDNRWNGKEIYRYICRRKIRIFRGFQFPCFIRPSRSCSTKKHHKIVDGFFGGLNEVHPLVCFEWWQGLAGFDSKWTWRHPDATPIQSDSSILMLTAWHDECHTPIRFFLLVAGCGEIFNLHCCEIPIWIEAKSCYQPVNKLDG